MFSIITLEKIYWSFGVYQFAFSGSTYYSNIYYNCPVGILTILNQKIVHTYYQSTIGIFQKNVLKKRYMQCKIIWQQNLSFEKLIKT